MTFPGPRPSLHPLPPWAFVAPHSPGTVPRRAASHRQVVPRSRWRTAGLVALAVFAGVTVLLGVVGWVALFVAVLA